MRYEAESVIFEPFYKVTDAVFYDGRLSLTWIEDDSEGRFDATSIDGIVFAGRFGYEGTIDDHRCVNFTLIRSNANELFFVGRWWNLLDEERKGAWAFRLTVPRQI